MAIIKRKPRNASLRFQTFLDNSDISKKTPEKSLTVGLRNNAGRNTYGRITMRHQGGGVKQKYRIIDFNRSVKDIDGIVKSIEYDPNRNVRIGLVFYANGVKKYILMPQNLTIGSVIKAKKDAEAVVGNSMLLRNIPAGFFVHNIELTPEAGGKVARSAGTSLQIMGKDEKFATMKMPSGEKRLFSLDCWATVGILGNADYKNICWGKAGRIRNKGVRPTVRGMAMNPIDHPHGGGEGRSKSGKHPVSPWGKGCKGTKTRKNKNNFKIISRRK